MPFDCVEVEDFVEAWLLPKEGFVLTVAFVTGFAGAGSSSPNFVWIFSGILWGATRLCCGISEWRPQNLRDADQRPQVHSSGACMVKHSIMYLSTDFVLSKKSRAAYR